MLDGWILHLYVKNSHLMRSINKSHRFSVGIQTIMLSRVLFY